MTDNSFLSIFSDRSPLSNFSVSAFIANKASLPFVLHLEIFVLSAFPLLVLFLLHFQFSAVSTVQCHSAINHDFYVLFYNILQSAECDVCFIDGKQNVLCFLRLVLKLANYNAKKLDAVIQYKISRRNQPVLVPGFHCSDGVLLGQFGSQQTC